jgi:hypothetical protein
MTALAVASATSRQPAAVEPDAGLGLSCLSKLIDPLGATVSASSSSAEGLL